MKKLFLIIALLVSVAASAIYDGSFGDLTPTSMFNQYKLTVNMNDGTTRCGYIYDHPTFPAQETMYNISALMKLHGYGPRVKVETAPNGVIILLTVYSHEWQYEYFKDELITQNQFILSIEMGRVNSNQNGAIIVRNDENGAFRYQSGEVRFPVVIWGANDTFSENFLKMKHLYEGNMGMHNETTEFEAEFLIYPIPHWKVLD